MTIQMKPLQLNPRLGRLQYGNAHISRSNRYYSSMFSLDRVRSLFSILTAFYKASTGIGSSILKQAHRDTEKKTGAPQNARVKLFCCKWIAFA